jgi:hypothetical protein
MKKFIGLLALVFLLFACKKNQESTTPLLMKAAPVCITLSDYDKLATTAEKAEWLREKGNLVCDSILYAKEIIHLVDSTEVTISNNAKPYLMKWTDLDQLMGTNIYEKYIGFEYDLDNNVNKVILIPLFLENGYSYSVPLFRSIALKYKFDTKSELEFIPATVKGQNAIVIRFKDSNGAWVYYDVYFEPV